MECALAGAQPVDVFNRTQERARELSLVIRKNTRADSRGEAWQPGLKIPSDTDILINATPVGLFLQVDLKPDIDYDSLHPGMIAADVVFNPASTLFLREASQRGALPVSGLGMLACQGALNFTLWTGKEAPLKLMEDTLRQEFEP